MLVVCGFYDICKLHTLKCDIMLLYYYYNILYNIIYTSTVIIIIHYTRGLLQPADLCGREL